MTVQIWKIKPSSDRRLYVGPLHHEWWLVATWIQILFSLALALPAKPSPYRISIASRLQPTTILISKIFFLGRPLDLQVYDLGRMKRNSFASYVALLCCYIRKHHSITKQKIKSNQIKSKIKYIFMGNRYRALPHLICALSAKVVGNIYCIDWITSHQFSLKELTFWSVGPNIIFSLTQVLLPNIMRCWQRSAAVEEDFYNLVVISVSGKYKGSDVWRKSGCVRW